MANCGISSGPNWVAGIRRIMEAYFSTEKGDDRLKRICGKGFR